MNGPVSAVVLAAGNSSRMGRPKQLLPWGRVTLLEHAIDAARGTCERVCVVLGAYETEIARFVPDGCVIVRNPDWAEGMHTSIRAAMRAIGAELPHTQAALFLTVDQPYVNAAALLPILAMYRSGAGAIVASEYAGTLGVPALFDAKFFDELAQLDRGGAKAVIARHLKQTARCEFGAGAIDVDTPENYRAAIAARVARGSV